MSPYPLASPSQLYSLMLLALVIACVFVFVIAFTNEFVVICS